MKNNLLSMLGLARRAGKLEAGFDASKASARGGKAALLAAAKDISDKTWKNLLYEAERAGIQAIRLEAGMEELGRACGVEAGVFAITDRKFSESVRVQAIAAKNEKEEEAT